VSPILSEDESTMREPLVLCRGCGALRSRHRSEWSPALAEDLAANPGFVFPRGAAFFVHANGLTAEQVASETGAGEHGRRAFDVWVDAGEYGRRLLFGRLRPDEIERAERDAAEAAR
jgi:hypothetical protein